MIARGNRWNRSPISSANAVEFHDWLTGYHDKASELWVGFHKVSSNKPSLTWPESVDAALCFGWIDGVRKSIDQKSYKIRFTPCKAGSKWSGVNLRRVEQLQSSDLMHEAGLRAFARRVAEKSEVYSYEQRHTIELEESQEKLFRLNRKAWTYFQEQANWYRKAALWWVVSAKREETRLKRLTQLIEYSEQGRAIPPLTRTPT